MGNSAISKTVFPFYLLKTACIHEMQFKGLGAPQQAFCNAKMADVYTSALLAGAMKPLNMLSKIWKSFCNRDRPFSSSTWSGRLFFAQEVFEFAIAVSRASRYHLASFEPDFLQIQLQNTCWASPKPDIPHKIALATRFRWYRISKFSWRKICSMKIGVNSFNIASNRNYHFRFFLGILLKYTENRKECFLKISSWLWYAFYKPSSNLENRTTVCMGYPAMTPKWESRKTPLKGAGNPCG